MTGEKFGDRELTELKEMLARLLTSDDPRDAAILNGISKSTKLRAAERLAASQAEDAKNRRADRRAQVRGRSWLVGRPLTEEEADVLGSKAAPALTLGERHRQEQQALDTLRDSLRSDPPYSALNYLIEDVLPVAIHILDMAAAGVVGAYTVSLRDRALSGVLKRRHSQPQLQDAVAVRASARWAINQVYREVLPLEIEPLVELVSPGRWTVIYDHDGWRYAASTAETADHDVQVQRQRLQST